MKRFLIKVVVFISLAAVSSCAAQDNLGKAEVKLGKATIPTPAGWTKSNDGNERINVTSPDGLQQATFSIMKFDVAPSFADFRRICSHRLEAEKAQAQDISITDEPAFEDAGTFGMFFSGKEISNKSFVLGVRNSKGT